MISEFTHTSQISVRLDHGRILGEYLRDGEGQGELLLLLQDGGLHPRRPVLQDTQQTHLLSDGPFPEPLH